MYQIRKSLRKRTNKKTTVLQDVHADRPGGLFGVGAARHVVRQPGREDARVQLVELDQLQQVVELGGAVVHAEDVRRAGFV